MLQALTGAADSAPFWRGGSMLARQHAGTEDLALFTLMAALSPKDHLEALISYQAAPTLMGEKPSNLLTFTRGRKDLLGAWRRYGVEVSSRLGLKTRELQAQGGCAVVLFYQEEPLTKTLEAPAARAYLQEAGYRSNDNAAACLERLQQRYAGGCPPEIGVFLGIPVEDIRGFVANGGRNCKLCRYWKVYGDPDDACARFSRFDQARLTMRTQLVRRFSQVPAASAAAVLC